MKSSPAIINTQGIKKFQMNVNQMLELYYLFRAPSVIKNLYVLQKYREDIKSYLKQLTKDDRS